VVTLDGQLFDRVDHIDLIHLDIEGSEPLALRGAGGLIDRSPNVKIIAEWNIGIMGHIDIQEFVAWLVERGFRFQRIEVNGELPSIEPSAMLDLPFSDVLMTR
jgi:hypothetical protein